jgi:TRAP-type C4-dicarboxylate transport system substrate-binding protein
MKAAYVKAAWVGAVLALGATPAAADEVNLVFATTTSAFQPPTPQILHPWAAAVNAAGKGIVKIEVRDGPAIASPQNFFDRVQNDVVQIAWGVPGSVGIFLLTDVARMPYVGDKGEDAAVAFWRLYKSGLLDDEYHDTHALEFGCFPQTLVHLSKAPKSIDGYEGLKLVANSKVAAETITRLGATPITLLIQEAYQGIQRHVVDGIVTGYPGILPFKLQDVTTAHIDIHMGGGMSFLIMAKKKFDSLPAAARKIMDDNSGEALSRKHGAFNDSEDARARKVLGAMPGQKLIEPSSEQHALFEKRLAPVAEQWAKSLPGAARVLAKYRELLAQVQKGT